MYNLGFLISDKVIDYVQGVCPLARLLKDACTF